MEYQFQIWRLGELQSEKRRDSIKFMSLYSIALQAMPFSFPSPASLIQSITMNLVRFDT